MTIQADLTIEEVDAPMNHWCSTGHVSAATFRREGAGTPALPTRFFKVSSNKAPMSNGVYCEPCLMVANAIKKMKKDRDTAWITQT